MVQIDLKEGECNKILSSLSTESVQSLITDPPAGISFMGKDWDKRDDFVQRMTEIYRECLRVLAPGAHGLVWAIPRTSHWTATALEQAGFEIRDVVTHVFGSGFPKSLDVSKAIDKGAGAKRETGPIDPERAGRLVNQSGQYETDAGWSSGNRKITIDPPATDEAKQWEGWGTALKPASEHWVLVRKPLSEPTVAKNVLKHGTGAINVDASRVPGHNTSVERRASAAKSGKYGRLGDKHNGDLGKYRANGNREEGLRNYLENKESETLGRFPANLVLSHNEDCVEQCTEGCAVAMLDEQSGQLSQCGGEKKTTHKDGCFGIGTPGRIYREKNRGASRFFYCAKSSKRDRGEGNIHPTVKSTKLMEYLIRLITPPDGTVLDPFMGSGSTGVAAKRLGFGFIGIEQQHEYFEIAEKRMRGPE